jgi:NAD(P)-dependent dehydrogenase (short-subunit alcohol dehydrogenase family)
VKTIGDNVTGTQGDVAKMARLDRLYETVGRAKGRIDIVAANAGVGEFAPFGHVTEEHFAKLFKVNVRGTVFTVQRALPLLVDGGSVILIGSVAMIPVSSPVSNCSPMAAEDRYRAEKRLDESMT